MQKLSVDIGASCPNRDGSIGRGGCIYCDNSTFVPSYCSPLDSVELQLEKGKLFFGKKYPEMRYLAYFQAYTSTYNYKPLNLLNAIIRSLQIDLIEGIILSTRPDCIDYKLLKQIRGVIPADKRLMFELGIETSHDSTLATINRNHDWKVSGESIRMLLSEGFDVGVHLIMGLPGENLEMMLQTVDRVTELGITSLKLHQLQIIKGTRLEQMIKNGEISVNPFDLDSYLNLCLNIIKRIPHNIAIERFTASSPAEHLIAPCWGIKNYEFVHLLNQRLLKEQ